MGDDDIRDITASLARIETKMEGLEDRTDRIRDAVYGNGKEGLNVTVGKLKGQVCWMWGLVTATVVLLIRGIITSSGA